MKHTLRYQTIKSPLIIDNDFFDEAAKHELLDGKLFAETVFSYAFVVDGTACASDNLSFDRVLDGWVNFVNFASNIFDGVLFLKQLVIWNEEIVGYNRFADLYLKASIFSFLFLADEKFIMTPEAYDRLNELICRFHSDFESKLKELRSGGQYEST